MTIPFQTALSNFGKNIKNFFSIHDNFLLLALFIAFIPFLIPQIIALIIAAFGLYFQFNKSFETNELPLIMAIIIIAVVNIFLGAYIFDSIYNTIIEIRDFIISIPGRIFDDYFISDGNFV